MSLYDLYEKLKKILEEKGYYFSKDRIKMVEFLAGLLGNMERYGYMLCPCRLASEDREKDKDIISPCV